MQTSTLLAITLPCILVPTLLACIVFARFKFRSSRRSRSAPVDPGHEARMNRFAQQKAETAQKEGWTVGSVLSSNWYGVTPVAGVGPNGTRTFLNGWFGLDGGRAAGKIRLPLAGLELCTSAKSGDSKEPPMLLILTFIRRLVVHRRCRIHSGPLLLGKSSRVQLFASLPRVSTLSTIISQYRRQ